MKSLGTRPLDEPTKKKPKLGYLGVVGQSLKNLEGGLKKKNMKESKVMRFNELFEDFQWHGINIKEKKKKNKKKEKKNKK